MNGNEFICKQKDNPDINSSYFHKNIRVITRQNGKSKLTFNNFEKEDLFNSSIYK